MHPRDTTPKGRGPTGRRTSRTPTSQQPLRAADRVHRIVMSAGGVIAEDALIARLTEWMGWRPATACVHLALAERVVRVVDIADGKRALAIRLDGSAR
jgi:hypothetical protein